jgi:hypothetical protein
MAAEMVEDYWCALFISLNRKGEPVLNYETIINLIGGTRLAPDSKSRPYSTRTTMRPASKSPTNNWKRYDYVRTEHLKITRSCLRNASDPPENCPVYCLTPLKYWTARRGIIVSTGVQEPDRRGEKTA